MKIKTHAQLGHELALAKRARDEARAALKEEKAAKEEKPAAADPTLQQKLDDITKQRDELQAIISTYDRDQSLLAARAVGNKERRQRHAAEAREQKLIETIQHMKNVQAELERALGFALGRTEAPEAIRKARARASMNDEKVEGLKHGTTGGYQDYGCRCFACTDANRLDCQRRRKAKIAQRLADDPDRYVHGKLATYTMAGCRCSVCKETNRLYQQEARQKKRALMAATIDG